MSTTQSRFICKCADWLAFLTILLAVMNATACTVQPDNNVILVISFASECCGTNQAAEKALQTLLDKEHQKRGAALAFTRHGWGKEGEHDYCFPLTELAHSDKRTFIAEVRQTLTGYKLVSVSESSTCPR